MELAEGGERAGDGGSRAGDALHGNGGGKFHNDYRNTGRSNARARHFRLGAKRGSDPGDEETVSTATMMRQSPERNAR